MQQILKMLKFSLDKMIQIKEGYENYENELIFYGIAKYFNNILNKTYFLLLKKLYQSIFENFNSNHKILDEIFKKPTLSYIKNYFL